MNVHTKNAQAPAPAIATDPVCGMTVDPATAQHRSEHAGQSYVFCSEGCRAKFVAAATLYTGDATPMPPAKPGTTYTCPMHPEIRLPGPGICPMCGMALETEDPAADAGPNPELVDFTRRFWIGLVLTLPVLAMEMGGQGGMSPWSRNSWPSARTVSPPAQAMPVLALAVSWTARSAALRRDSRIVPASASPDTA